MMEVMAMREMIHEEEEEKEEAERNAEDIT